MRLFCYNTDVHGCYWYRLLTPFNEIKGNAVEDSFNFDFKIKEVKDVRDYDLVVVQRASDALGVAIVEEARASGVPVVYEVDDSLFNIDPVNPAFGYFNRQDVQHCIKHVLDLSDGLSVSTKPLADFYLPFFNHGEIAILPNSIDPYKLDKITDVKRRPMVDFRILVTGGISHKGDWGFIFDALQELVSDTKGRIEIMMFGYMPEEFKKIPNLLFVKPVPVEKYFSVLASLDYDLMLVPLEDIEFNKYKSNLKFVESGALSRPVLASPVYPYSNSISNGDNGWIVPNKVYSWKKQILKLYRSREEVKEAGRNSRETVENKFNLKKNYRLWVEFYNRLLVKYNKPLIELREGAA